MPAKQVDSYDIFAQAEGFSEAAGILSNNTDSPTGNSMVGLAGSVSHVFAIELYIKCLLLLENTAVPKEHNLTELFNLLTPATKDLIKCDYNRGIPIHLPKIKSIKLTFPPNNKSVNTDFDVCLSTIEDNFQKLRYLYEHKRGAKIGQDPSSYILLLAVRAQILMRHPEWYTGYPAIIKNMVIAPLTSVEKIITKNFEVTHLAKDLQQYVLLRKCANGECHWTPGIVFDMELGLDFPKLLPLITPISYPRDGVFHCPICHAKSYHGILKEALERYTKRKVVIRKYTL